MPRLSQSLPKYRRHKASGQAIVTLNGRDHYLGPYGSKTSRKEYDRLVAEWMANNRQLLVTAADGLTIVELAVAYYRHACSYYRKDGKVTTTISRVKAALHVLKELYGHTQASDFGPLALQAVQQKLIQDGKSRRYINYLCEEIKRTFRWAVSQEMLPPSQYHGLAAVTGLRKGRSEAYEPGPIRPVSDDVVQRTLPHLPEVVADMVRFQRLTGCRPGEVCILRPIDVDTSGKVWHYTPSTHKTEHHGKRRTILIGPKAQDVLRRYLLRPAESYCFSPLDSERKRLENRLAARKTPMSCGNRPGSNRKQRPRRAPNECYTNSSYMRAIVRGCEAAFGMPPELRRIDRRLPEEKKAQLRRSASAWRAQHSWKPNQLRHSAATEIRSKFGAEAAQVVLGHAHLNVTEVYAERDLLKAAAVMERLG